MAQMTKGKRLGKQSTFKQCQMNEAQRSLGTFYQLVQRAALHANQSINQSVNQSINQSINQSVNQSINQSIAIGALSGWLTSKRLLLNLAKAQFILSYNRRLADVAGA